MQAYNSNSPTAGRTGSAMHLHCFRILHYSGIGEKAAGGIKGSCISNEEAVDG